MRAGWLALVLVAAMAAPVHAASPCSVDVAVLGQLTTLTGPTDTDWFNVIDLGFEPSAVISFDVPVIPYSVEVPTSVMPAATSFPAPPGDKGTFRTRDLGIDSVNVSISDGACKASSLVRFGPPPTDTFSDGHEHRSSGSPTIAVLAFAFLASFLLGLRQRRSGRWKAG